MKTRTKPKCSECGGRVTRKTVTQKFEKEGVSVELAGLEVDVCSECGEIYFQPGGAQRVVDAVNSLFSLALSEGQHRGTLSARFS